MTIKFNPARAHRQASRRQSSLWTPKSVSMLSLWLDATDASTITKDGSDLVTEWKDKSGNQRHATATGTGRPTWVADGMNDKASLDFNGSSNFMTLPDLNITGARTIIIAYQPTDIDGMNTGYGNSLIRKTSTPSAIDDFFFAVRKVSAGLGQVSSANWTVPNQDFDGLTHTDDSVVLDDTDIVATSVWNGTTAALRASGTDQAVSTATSALNWGTAAEIGRTFPHAAYYYEGLISEILIYNKVLTDAELFRLGA